MHVQRWPRAPCAQRRQKKSRSKIRVSVRRTERCYSKSSHAFTAGGKARPWLTGTDLRRFASKINYAPGASVEMNSEHADSKVLRISQKFSANRRQIPIVEKCKKVYIGSQKGVTTVTLPTLFNSIFKLLDNKSRNNLIFSIESLLLQEH